MNTDSLRQDLLNEVGLLLQNYDEARGRLEIDKAIENGIDALEVLVATKVQEARINQLTQDMMWVNGEFGLGINVQREVNRITKELQALKDKGAAE